MAFFEFPHTRTYDSDLGWLIAALKRVENKLDHYLEQSVITFADPIDWNITTQYPALTCVIDPSDGTAYLSVQPVPSGILITDTDYWTPIYNYEAQLDPYIQTFPIVADMEAGDLEEGNVCRTLGYYAVNDYGGLMYLIKSTNDYTYDIALNNGLYATPITNEDYVTPEMFGYDGSTITTTAIQAAVKFACDNGLKTVKFFRGDYYVDGTINIYKNITLRGAVGDRKTHIKQTVNSIDTFVCSYPQIVFDNLTIETQNLLNGTGTGISFLPSDAYGVNCDGIVQNCELSGFNIGILYQGRNLLVRNCHFSYTNYGIYLTNSNTYATEEYRGQRIENCRFHYCGNNAGNTLSSAAIMSDYNISADLSFDISNNYADYCSLFFQGCLGSGRISDNYIRHIKNNGIRAVFATPGVNAAGNGAVISGNMIDGDTEGYRGIYLKNLVNVAIMNNVIRNFKDYCLRGETCENLMVDGLYFGGLVSHIPVYFVHCDHLTIHNLVQAIADSYNTDALAHVNLAENAPEFFDELVCNVQGNIVGFTKGDVYTGTAATNVTINSASVIKQNNHVIIGLDFTPTANLASMDPIYQLPDGLYRKNQGGANLNSFVSIVYMKNGAADNAINRVYVDGNGYVRSANGSLTSGTQQKLMVEYFI